MRVRVGVSQGPVAEGNCVIARWGGEQLEANWRSVGDELDSAAQGGELARVRRSLKITGCAVLVGKATFGPVLWLESERQQVCTYISGEAC